MNRMLAARDSENTLPPEKRPRRARVARRGLVARLIRPVACAARLLGFLDDEQFQRFTTGHEFQTHLRRQSLPNRIAFGAAASQ